MQVLPSHQQITWFLDLDRTEQLDLSPPYQRNSIWSRKDRQFFLDTIFRNYPCPSIFIHRTTDGDTGRATYSVVDGKQRLETIMKFSKDELEIADDYGDADHAGKRFSELSPALKKVFWDYALAVNMTDTESSINAIYDRLNRNAKNLNRQELRRAKYDGWFITEAEREAEGAFWERFSFNKGARLKRMKNVQFISELMMVILERDYAGLDQDHISKIYSDYDDPKTNLGRFDAGEYVREKERIQNYIADMERHSKEVVELSDTTTRFYTLWSVVALCKDALPDPGTLADRYVSFMRDVDAANKDPASAAPGREGPVRQYLSNSKEIPTGRKQREGRFDALKGALLLADN